jgi:AmiR/NasT family two-component response regulator
MQQTHLKHSLETQGHEVVAQADSMRSLAMQADILRPDVILVAVARLDVDTLRHTCLVCQTLPIPMVVLTGDPDARTMHKASRAGVAAYVVGNTPPARLSTILHTALLRYRAQATLKTALGALRDQLPEENLIASAQHRIMRELRMPEVLARQRLGRYATTQGVALSKAARQILDASCMEPLLAV